MTYKQVILKQLDRKIFLYDLNHSKSIQYGNSTFWNDKALHLREIRKKALALHGSHFVPNRHPSAEYLSIFLSLTKLAT
jgi:hypothetical protein